MRARRRDSTHDERVPEVDRTERPCDSVGKLRAQHPCHDGTMQANLTIDACIVLSITPASAIGFGAATGQHDAVVMRSAMLGR